MKATNMTTVIQHHYYSHNFLKTSTITGLFPCLLLPAHKHKAINIESPLNIDNPTEWVYIYIYKSKYIHRSPGMKTAWFSLFPPAAGRNNEPKTTGNIGGASTEVSGRGRSGASHNCCGSRSNNDWFVVDLPLWKIWKSNGMIIPN